MSFPEAELPAELVPTFKLLQTHYDDLRKNFPGYIYLCIAATKLYDMAIITRQESEDAREWLGGLLSMPGACVLPTLDSWYKVSAAGSQRPEDQKIWNNLQVKRRKAWLKHLLRNSPC